MTKKDKMLLPIGVSALVASFVIAGLSTANLTQSKYKKSDGLDHYTLELDGSNAPSTLTSSYQDSVSGTYTTGEGNSITLNFVKAKSVSGKHVDLASRGMIYNFASESGGISGITAMTVIYSGSTMSLRTSLANALPGGASTENLYTISSGSRLELPSPRYFSLLAADGGNIITSISIEYTCGLNESINRLDGEFTGTGNDGYRYSLVLSNGNVTFSSLDKNPSITATGTGALTGNSLECSFTSPSAYNGLVYSFTADAQSHALTYVSKSGTGNANVPEINLTRVYNVEDFENYSSRGNGWDTSSEKAASKYDVTGVRGEFICEYSGNGSSGPIGGSGWLLMGSTDYLSFNTTAGHNSSKCVAIKGNTNTMRYIQASAYYGVPRILGKGNKLSFWSKGAFSNSGMSNASSYSTSLTLYAFYTQKVTSSTFNQRTEKNFIIANNNDWTEYTMDLDPNRTYYSFGLMTHNYDNANRYLAIDDVKIFSTSNNSNSNYAPSGNFHGTATRRNNQGTYPIFLSLSESHKASLILAGSEYATGYSFSEDTISITTSNSSWLGTFTAKYNKATNEVTEGTFSGSIKNNNSTGITNNGSITFTELQHTWYCNEDGADLQNTFKRRYQSNGVWQIDTVNDDRVVSISYASVSGGRAVRRRGYTSGAVGIVLQNDLATPLSVSNLLFWVYNPSNNDITFRTWIYKTTELNDEQEIEGGSSVAKANSWTFIQIGFSKCNVYNFSLCDFTKSGVTLAYDNISLY